VTDIVKIALAVGRDEFVSMYSMPLLAGSNAITQSERLTLSASEISLDWSDRTFRLPQNETPTGEMDPNLAIFPVKKVQPIFPNMVTVGRNTNNDIVLADASISKLHAFFEPGEAPNSFVLKDAASTNGTFVDERRVPKSGKGIAVSLRSQVRFGNLSFTLLDAGACWDLVHGVQGA
jgi:hypothetical protein